MTSDPSAFRDYKRYVSDPKWAETYSKYQKQYAVEPRESDKKSAALVKAALLNTTWKPRVLDVGCSTGNFLRYLRQRIDRPVDLVGGDLMAPVIEECRKDPSLEGIAFEVMDVFDVPASNPYDVVVANAVNVYFEPDEYIKALKSIGRAMKPGGTFIAYEWVFPHDREQRIVEKSEGHPEGLKFWFRSEDFIQEAFAEAGFVATFVLPFDIPIDLPKPELTGTDADLKTYTVRDPITGKRNQFRGALYQPWAHITSRRM